MKKLTREPITRKMIYDDLVSEIKSTFPWIIVGFVAITAVMIPAGIIIIDFSSGNTLMMKIVSVFAGVVLLVLPVALLAAIIWEKARGRFNPAYYENFTVAEDELVDITEETVVRRGRRGKRILVEEKVFYFYKHGRYRIDARDNSAYQYSDKGDTFYLVLLDDRIAYVYNAKIYEYKGILGENK